MELLERRYSNVGLFINGLFLLLCQIGNSVYIFNVKYSIRYVYERFLGKDFTVNSENEIFEPNGNWKAGKKFV